MTNAPTKTVTAVTTDTLRLALRPADAEVLEFITKSPDDCLQYRNADGSIDLDGVREMMVDIERKKILDGHPFSISQGNDGRWRTRVLDETAKTGRRQIGKSTREKLEDAIVEYYLRTDERLTRIRMTLRELYPKWLKYKALHNAETYIPRIESEWNRFYKNSTLVDKPIRDLKKLELDEWAHSLIR